jgi:WD40 repeat protein
MKSFDSAAFSPSGTAAILYGSECKCVQVIGGLPESPRTIRTTDLASLPSPVSALAIADDASVAALAVPGTEDGASPGQIFLLDPNAEGPPRRVVISGASALAFSPNGKDLAIAGSGSVLLARNVAGSGDVISFGTDGDSGSISSPSAAAFASDGLLIVADRVGMVHVIDLQKNQKQSIACACKPDSVERMKVRSTYRLTGIDTGAVWILETSESDIRVLFIPVDPATEAAQ